MSPYGLTCKDHLHGLGSTYCLGKANCATGSGHDTEGYLWEAELRILGSKKDITHHGKFEATPKRHSINGCNQWVSKGWNYPELYPFIEVLEKKGLLCR